MAKTKLQQYSVQEKLNKMDIDLIDVTLTTVAAAIGDNEVISQSIEIPNATYAKGGNCLIKSLSLMCLLSSLRWIVFESAPYWLANKDAFNG